MAIRRDTNNLKLPVWGTKLPNKYGEEYLQSINGDNSNSAFKLIDDWAGTVNAVIGTSPFSTDAKTLTSAINELHNDTTLLKSNYINNIKVNGISQVKTNNEVNLLIPTKTSEIENDSHKRVELTEEEVSKDSISFGDAIKIVKEVIRDENGHITQIKSVNSTFPVVSTSELDVGSGNAITSITVNNGVIRGFKEETFAKVSELHNHDNKEYLDKIGEDANGDFTYNGNIISGKGNEVKVSVNGIEYKADENELITLPDYPTTLPASDVHDWAKAENKPTYTADEVGALASNGTATNSSKVENSLTLQIAGATINKYDGSFEQIFNVPEATTTNSGVMTTSQVEKLNNIAESIEIVETDITNIKTKTDLIDSTGDGTKFLADNGQYLTFENEGTKETFNCTLTSGLSFTYQDCYVLNGVVFINIGVIASTPFEVEKQTLIATIPDEYKIKNRNICIIGGARCATSYPPKYRVGYSLAGENNIYACVGNNENMTSFCTTITYVL